MKERLQELLKKGYTSLKFAEIMEVQPPVYLSYIIG